MTKQEREKRIREEGKNFCGMYDIHVRIPDGPHSPGRWLAAHIGKLTARMEMLEREVRALRKKVTG